MAVVSNSGPLLRYAKISRLDLLHALFSAVVIPQAVFAEVVTAGLRRQADATDALAVQAAIDAGWITVANVTDRSWFSTIERVIDRGEAEAIALARERGLPILLDDRVGRRVAHAQGLLMNGSAGVLLLAKQRQLIDAVRPLLDTLLAADLYLSEAVYREVLTLAGE
ncbi:MAG TPA: DUF3368 domain-containing protein [Chloroflexota bacterium]|jgi:hypothetical protein|nr:DUF3368 domain-containing protein [Chloroflexota bacterium]